MQRSVRSTMTSEVVTVPPDEPFKGVVRLLAQHGVDALPVVDAGGELLGVVSARDLTCHEEEPPSLAHLVVGGRGAREHARKARGRTARELMTSPARTVSPDAEACEALRDMTRGKVGRLVVVEQGRVVGILTRSDLLRVFLRSDEELQREASVVVRDLLGEDAAGVEATVTDGVVSLRGRVGRTSQAWAAAAAARDVPGVVDVEDALVAEVDDTLVHELSVRGPFV